MASQNISSKDRQYWNQGKISPVHHYGIEMLPSQNLS